MMTDSNVDPLAAFDPAPERTLIVVPTYNEVSNIAELVRQIFSTVPNVHLLVVDDDSPDGTAEAVEKLMATYPNLGILRRQGERGLGRAYTAGILHGLENGFQIIGTMDADLSHNPAYLPQMLILLKTCDVVIGSRYVRDGAPKKKNSGPFFWRVFNKFAAMFLRFQPTKLLRFKGFPLETPPNGFGRRVK